MQKIKCSVNGYLDDKTFRTFDLNIEIPDCPDSYLNSVVRKRYVVKEIAKQFKVNVQHVSTCYIESVEQIKKDCSFYGKSILDFNEDDFQDFATEFCFIEIPLRRKASLTDMQNKTIKLFLEELKGIKLESIKGFYKFDELTGSRYEDYDYFRQPENRKLFIIKKENKKELKNKELKQNSLEELLAQKEINEYTSKENTSKDKEKAGKTEIE